MLALLERIDCALILPSGKQFGKAARDPCELWCPKVAYSQHLRIFTQGLSLDSAAKRAILGDTARRLWFEQRG